MKLKRPHRSTFVVAVILFAMAGCMQLMPTKVGPENSLSERHVRSGWPHAYQTKHYRQPGADLYHVLQPEQLVAASEVDVAAVATNLLVMFSVIVILTLAWEISRLIADRRSS
jgi:hypothetical protein